jgi:hypothetical protein
LPDSEIKAGLRDKGRNLDSFVRIWVGRIPEKVAGIWLFVPESGQNGWE